MLCARKVTYSKVHTDGLHTYIRHVTRTGDAGLKLRAPLAQKTITVAINCKISAKSKKKNYNRDFTACSQMFMPYLKPL